MRLSRINRFKILQIFGDGKPHNWFEVINFGVRLLQIHQYKFEALFNRCLEYQLIRREWKACVDKDDDFSITPRGDECLREEQIARDGDYLYYKHFDRTIKGKWGLDHFAPIPKKYRKKPE